MNPTAPLCDQIRLGTQLAHVIGLMSDSRPRTIPEICRELLVTKSLRVSETGCAARCREARKHGWTVNKWRAFQESGLYVYQFTRTNT